MSGFIVIAQRKDSDIPSRMTMAYGRPNDPEPGLLLLRDRATVFKTIDDAKSALGATIHESMKRLHPWPELYQFYFIECEDHQ